MRDESHPWPLQCGYCQYIRMETLERALAGKLDYPLWCPSCQRDLDPDWEPIEKACRDAGLLPPED